MLMRSGSKSKKQAAKSVYDRFMYESRSEINSN
jgi:hypothetical protein